MKFLLFEMIKHFICRNKDAMKDFISAEDETVPWIVFLFGQNVDDSG